MTTHKPYAVYRHKSEFKGTDMMEIGPGKFSGTYWVEGFVFVYEDDFLMAEGAVHKYFSDYDHWGWNEIHRNAGLKIIADWRIAGQEILACTKKQIFNVLFLNIEANDYFFNSVYSERQDISRMLWDLADICERFYADNEWICMIEP